MFLWEGRDAGGMGWSAGHYLYSSPAPDNHMPGCPLKHPPYISPLPPPPHSQPFHVFLVRHL